jgi:hypothetical protein
MRSLLQCRIGSQRQVPTKSLLTCSEYCDFSSGICINKFLCEDLSCVYCCLAFCFFLGFFREGSACGNSRTFQMMTGRRQKNLRLFFGHRVLVGMVNSKPYNRAIQWRDEANGPQSC